MSATGSQPAQSGEFDDLRVTVETRGPATVLMVAGELDMLTADKLEQAISTALDSRPQTLVVDLSKVEFMASAGMNVLLAARDKGMATTRFRVVATGHATLRPLQVAGLTEYIAVFDSLGAALLGP